MKWASVKGWNCGAAALLGVVVGSSRVRAQACDEGPVVLPGQPMEIPVGETQSRMFRVVTERDHLYSVGPREETTCRAASLYVMNPGYCNNPFRASYGEGWPYAYYFLGTGSLMNVQVVPWRQWPCGYVAEVTDHGILPSDVHGTGERATRLEHGVWHEGSIDFPSDADEFWGELEAGVYRIETLRSAAPASWPPLVPAVFIRKEGDYTNIPMQIGGEDRQSPSTWILVPHGQRHTYWIRLSDASNSQFTYGMKYRIRLVQAADSEYQNALSVCATEPILRTDGIPRVYLITPSNERYPYHMNRWLPFEVIAGHVYHVQVVNADVDYSLQGYNVHNDCDANSPGLHSIVRSTFQAQVSETWRVQLAYWLLIPTFYSVSVVDEGLVNDLQTGGPSAALPLILDAPPTSGRIDYHTDEDWYSVSVPPRAFVLRSGLRYRSMDLILSCVRTRRALRTACPCQDHTTMQRR